MGIFILARRQRRVEIHGRGRAHAWEIPPVQHHLSLAGEGKHNISIKVSSDICGPSRILSGAGQNLCLLIAGGSEGNADILN